MALREPALEKSRVRGESLRSLVLAPLAPTGSPDSAISISPALRAGVGPARIRGLQEAPEFPRGAVRLSDDSIGCAFAFYAGCGF